jgi:hypothetical protein
MQLAALLSRHVVCTLENTHTQQQPSTCGAAAAIVQQHCACISMLRQANIFKAVVVGMLQSDWSQKHPLHAD